MKGLNKTELARLQVRARGTMNAQHLSLSRHLAARHIYARTYSIKVLGTLLAQGPSLADELTLLTPAPDDRGQDHLLLGDRPVAREVLSWDPQGHVLSWRQGSGEQRVEGHITLLPDHTKGFGFIRQGDAHYSVEIDLKPVSYTCAVSVDAGQYLSGGASGPKLNWDTRSNAWRDAHWIEGALRFTYGLTDNGPFIGQPDPHVMVAFNDLQSDVEWAPEPEADFTVLLTPEFRLVFSANQGVEPAYDDRGDSPVKSVFPYQLAFDFDGFGASFQGAYLTGENTVLGTAYAIRGVVDNPAIAGFYGLVDHTTGRHQGLVLVRGGQLLIDGQPVADSRVEGNALHWQGLSNSQCAASGLPQTGHLLFSDNGDQVVEGAHGGVGVRHCARSLVRLAQALDQHDPALRAGFVQLGALQHEQLLGDPALNIHTLLGMSPFQEKTVTENGVQKKVWTEIIRENAMADFYQVLQYYMDPGLRSQFISPNPPVLSPQVKSIAAMKGSKGQLPQDWYPSLGVAYLSSALARVDDPGAPYLNGERAGKWLSQQVAVDDVYQTQAPALYANRWKMQFSDTALFLRDQSDNNATYVPLIDQDLAMWIQQIKATVTGEQKQIDELVKLAEDTAKKGKEQLYWAYLMFRYCTQPSALNNLRVISLNGNTGLDGSAFAQRIQTNMAVLNVLDPSGFFCTQYSQVIQTFQVGNILPTLIDYSGNLDEYVYAVDKVITAFIQAYGSSTDKQILDMVAQLREVQRLGQVREILDTFASLAQAFAGIYEWEKLAGRFAATWPKLSKIGLGVAKAVTLAAASVGIAAFVYGVMDWKNLKDEQRAQVVLGGMQVFAQLLGTVLRKGTAYTTIFRTENTVGSFFRTVWRADTLELANQRAGNGLSRWLVRDAALEARLIAAGAEEDMTVAMRIFGRNLDEFIATRLGALFAIANIVLSAIAIANSESDLETAANALLLSSASLELLAIVGQWALAGFGVEAIGGLAVATIASCMTALAAFAAIAGVIILLVLAFRPQKTPIQKFAEDQARKAGFYMEDKASIDALNVSSSTDGRAPQLVGIALQYNGQRDQTLTFNGNGSLGIGQQKLDFSTNFFLSSDAFGNATLSTLLTQAGSTANGTPRQEYVCITLDDDRKLAAKVPLGSKDKVGQQQWASEFAGGAVFDDKQALVAARFRFYNVYWAAKGQKLYLSSDGGSVTASASATAWTVALTTMAPSLLAMSDFNLWDYNRDQRVMPYLGQPGSVPRAWRITPALPDFLVFDTTNGTVSQKKGIAPTAMGSKSYTVTVSNDYGEASCSFSIKVSVYVPPVMPPIMLADAKGITA
ncbi:Ig domain-containing protein [Pseudomonas soli]|uniref:Ig domain-containing protein n=1 Tax=Pseudomonas soli TaxID=1306993 RepID=UPI0038014F1E